MSKRKFTEKHIPEGVTARFKHLRNPDRTIYATVCLLVDNITDEVLESTRARVSLKDNPSKKIGRAISLGRALKKYYGGR